MLCKCMHYTICRTCMQRGLRHFTLLLLRTLHRPATAACDTHVEMSAKLNALVIGGSIGGLSTAHALLRAGCGVTVLERAPEVSGNSLGAVSHLLFPEAEQKSFRVFV
jgi:heterodisulfide reductase subunit A-like polyferredoxin